MKKITGLMLILLMISAVSCSSRKKYADIREFINEVVSTQNEFLSGVEKASNADDVVIAISVFGNKLVKLSEKSMEIKKRYPDFDNLANNPPAELKADLEKLDNAGNSFEKIFLKENIKVLIREKKVQTAFIDLGKKMESVKFFQ